MATQSDKDVDNSITFVYNETDRYPRWPQTARALSDTVYGAKLASDWLSEAQNEDDFWVGVEDVVRASGIPSDCVRKRLRAARDGEERAWPWTPIRPGPQAYLPALFMEVRWVTRQDMINYLDISESTATRLPGRGDVRAEHRPFRYSDKRRKAYLYDDIVEMKFVYSLRELFGVCYSHDILRPMSELSPSTVSHIKLAHVSLSGGF